MTVEEESPNINHRLVSGWGREEGAGSGGGGSDSPVGAPSIICLDWMPAWFWEHSLINIQHRVEDSEWCWMTDPAFFRFTAPPRQPDDGAGSVFKDQNLLWFLFISFFCFVLFATEVYDGACCSSPDVFLPQVCQPGRRERLWLLVLWAPVCDGAVTCALPPPVAVSDQRSAEMSKADLGNALIRGVHTHTHVHNVGLLGDILAQRRQGRASRVALGVGSRDLFALRCHCLAFAARSVNLGYCVWHLCVPTAQQCVTHFNVM